MSNGVIVASGQTYTISAGQTDTNDIIFPRAILMVDGTSINATIYSDGVENVNAGGIDIGATIWGYQDDFGVTNGDVVSGGFQFVEAGGVANSTVIAAGPYNAQQYVDPGGVANGTIVENVQQVYLGGTANNNVIESGGTENIRPLGVDNGAQIGGTQYVSGSANGDTVLAGGVQHVFYGGTATGTTVYGLLDVSGISVNFGNTSGTLIEAGGREIVEADGRETSTTIDGGTLELVYGARLNLGDPVSFTANGGDLQLDATGPFAGMAVAGWGANAEIDLGDIAFGKKTKLSFHEDKSKTFGTLTVTDSSGHTASLTLLGQFSAGAFNLASVGHGGTLVTDPQNGNQGGPNLVAHT
jgi:autotransporter passenger strand-loop-strand repeat protein